MKVTREQADEWWRTTADSPFNRWLNPQVQGPDGALDLDRLHAVARRYGVDKQADYAHLNPGQQRMNIGNLLRKRVDPEEYGGDPGPRARVRTSTPRPAPAMANPESQQTPVRSEPRSELVRGASVGALLRTHGEILDELFERGVIRTLNSPTGDYAELLFSRAFGWTLEGNSSAGHDATDAHGVRFQIKCRRLTPRNGSRQLSAIRRLDAATFDYVAAVLFDASFQVFRAAIIPHSVIASRARYRPHTNAWLFELKDAVWDLPGVRDVTEQVRAAAGTV